MHEACERMSLMLWQCTSIADMMTEHQVGWRLFFAWLLQRLQILDAAEGAEMPQPPDTDSILQLLQQMQSEDFDKGPSCLQVSIRLPSFLVTL